MEIRAYRFETRDLGDAGTFTGYASVFGNVDQHGTIVDKGSFKKTLKENGNFLPLLFYHDPTLPIGSFSGEEDDHGLRIDGKLDLDVERGRDVYSGIKKGYIDRMSIGFTPITEIQKDGATHFKEIRLWESSLVTRNFASNDQALVTDVRAASLGLRRVSEAIAAGDIRDFDQRIAELRLLLDDLDARCGAGGGAAGYKGGRSAWRSGIARDAMGSSVKSLVSAHSHYHAAYEKDTGSAMHATGRSIGLRALPDSNWEDGKPSDFTPTDLKEAHWIIVAAIEKKMKDQGEEFDHPPAPEWAKELVARRSADDCAADPEGSPGEVLALTARPGPGCFATPSQERSEPDDHSDLDLREITDRLERMLQRSR